MIANILEWMGQANKAVLDQGPMVTIFLSLLGGYAAGQFLKFPIKYFSAWPEVVENWAIRCGAVSASFLIGVWLGGLKPAIIMVVALCQPMAYRLSMMLIRKYVPWLAATPIGSATPTADDEFALTQWREKDKP